jgi:hypothetical protein
MVRAEQQSGGKMNLFDPCAAYSRALDVAMQWHRLARTTDNPRHLATALICSRIAYEAFAKVPIEQLDEPERQALLQRQDAAAREAHPEEMQRYITDCRARLAAAAPAPLRVVA